MANRGLRAYRQPEALSAARSRIRIARVGDAAGILALMRPYYAADGYPFDSRRGARVLRAFLRRPAWGRAWVVTLGRQILGYAVVTLGYSLEYGGRDAFVDEIVVAPALRGQGLGRRLLRAAETWCRRKGVAALHLEVERQHRGPIGLYRELGFVPSGRMLMTRKLRPGPRPSRKMS